MIPLPFGRGRFVYGEPLRVPREAGETEREEARRRLEQSLQRLTEEVCGPAEWKS